MKNNISIYEAQVCYPKYIFFQFDNALWFRLSKTKKIEISEGIWTRHLINTQGTSEKTLLVLSNTGSGASLRSVTVVTDTTVGIASASINLVFLKTMEGKKRQ